jgi:maltooligosyltrehalose trehalohydrolase
MFAEDRGYHILEASEIEPGTFYYYELDDGSLRPDPASHSQPHGVHEPSEVIDHAEYVWRDQNWQNLAWHDYIIYELHIGTYSREGTFDGAIRYLDDLKRLGVTAVEVMPIAQFPGSRNWGYDGVHPFAPQSTYGGVSGFKRFVDACHERGLAVVLDVVYNHLGPEGNYLPQFGFYMSETHRTPWGEAINFDGPFSDDVRRFFIENAAHWITQFHVDALRLDAVHAIFDASPVHFLRELHEKISILGQKTYLIAETDADDPRVVEPTDKGGYQMTALWNDDYHHNLHVLLTGENTGYYMDYGQPSQLAKTINHGFAYIREFSHFRCRTHGRDASHLPTEQFVVCSQNHDQVGNRALGDRLAMNLDEERLKLAAGLVLFSPFVPLLFMGEEFAASTPFAYFISHTDAELVGAVRKGRKNEFRHFKWQDEIPDPQDPETFESSKLDHESKAQEKHKRILSFYQLVIEYSKKMRSLSLMKRQAVSAEAEDENLTLLIYYKTPSVLCGLFANFHPERSWEIATDKISKFSHLWLNTNGDSWCLGTSSIARQPEQSLVVAPSSFVLLSSIIPPKSLGGFS